MTTKILLKKRDCTIKVGALVASPNTTNTLYDQITDSVTGGIKAWMEEASVTFPEGPVEKVDYHGEDAAGFQNQSLEEQSWGVAKATLKFTYSPVDVDKVPSVVFASGSGTAVTSGETRFQYGGSTAANLRVAKGIGFEFTDGTKIIDVGMNNALASIKDVSMSGNRWSVSIEVTCLTKDFYEEVQSL
jgi:hypothetical protein